MVYLYIFLTLILLGILYMRFEASFLKVETLWLTKNKNALKVIQISDVHIHHMKVSPEKIRKIIAAQKPDLLLLSGDYIQKTGDISKFLDFLDYITGFCPVYLVFGNHDHYACRKDPEAINKFTDAITAKGIILIQNRCVRVEKNGKTYDLIGLGDLRCKMYNFSEAFSDISKAAHARIAFTHNPDLVLELPENAVDYLFCGHFHGGQIWAPFALEFKLLRSDILCKRGVCKGLHRVNGINLYINRGIGNVMVPLRFLSRPEITVAYIP